MARKLKTSAVDAGQSLVTFLVARLGDSEEATRERILAGSVYVGRSRARDPGRQLTLGELVVVHEAGSSAPVGWRVARRIYSSILTEGPVVTTRD